MSQSHGISVRQWAREYLNSSPATGYRALESEDPPPVFITPGGRKLVAVHSPEYSEWVARRMTVNKNAAA